MKPGKAIIAGGSVGGLFASVLLMRAGWQVAIYERSASGLAGKGAGLVPQEEVGRILRLIGRGDVLRSGVMAVERIFLDKAGQVVAAMDSPQTQISWDMLFAAFRSAVSDAHYRNGHTVRSIELTAGQATVEFDDGKLDHADLVIGADGIGSTVRSLVAPDTAPRYAGYAAFRGLREEAALPPASAAVLADRFAFYNADRTQVLGYLVAGSDGSIEPGQRRYNWVWYRSLTPAQLDAALSSATGGGPYSAPSGGLSAATRAEMHESAERLLPSVFGDVIRAEPAPFLQAIFDYEAPRMVKGRMVLLGDAAFVARPHTAMGVSKAAADAMSLSKWLMSAETLDAALSAYEAERHPAGKAIVEYGRRLGQPFETHG